MRGEPPRGLLYKGVAVYLFIFAINTRFSTLDYMPLMPLHVHARTVHLSAVCELRGCRGIGGMGVLPQLEQQVTSSTLKGCLGLG